MMKQFKKALSLTLAVIMLVSVCAIAFGTFGVSATTLVDASSDNIFSLTHNTYLYDFKENTGKDNEAWMGENATATVNSYRTDASAINEYPIVHNVVSNMVTLANKASDKSYLSPNDGGMVFYGTQTINDSKYGLTGQFYHKMAFKDPDVSRNYSADTNNSGKYYARLEKGKYYIFQADLTQPSGVSSAQVMFVTHPEDQVIGKGQDSISYSETVAGDTVVTATYECNTDAKNGDIVLLAVYGTVIVKSLTVHEFDAATVKAYYDGITPGNDVKIKFDNGTGDFFAPQGSNTTVAKYEVVSDPLNSGRGSVLKSTFVNNAGGGYGFSIPAAPGLGGYANNNYSEGYAFKDDHKYYVSFDVYHDMADRGTVETINIYASKAANVAASDGKAAVVSSTWTEAVNYSNKVGAWGTYAGTFTYAVSGSVTSEMVHPYFNIAGVANSNHVMYWDNITIVDLGVATESTTVGTITLSGVVDNTTDNVIKVTQEQVGSVITLPRLADTSDAIFAGWTTDWRTANDAISGGGTKEGDFAVARGLSAQYASTLRATGKTENQVYYAIWVKRSHVITFGKTTDTDYPYINNHMCATGDDPKMLSEVSASMGLVSKGWWLADTDNDTEYELRYYSTAGQGYKVALGEYDSVLGHNRFVNVHEGVTYKFKINMKVNSFYNNHIYVYMTRYRGGDFSQAPLNGGTESGATVVHSLNTTGVHEFTTEGFMVEGLYNLGSNGATGNEGNTNAMARTIKNMLALQMYGGDVEFESIEIIAESWTDTESAIIYDSSKGSVTVENGKITVTPAAGYAIDSNGIKVERTRNYQTSLGYYDDIKAAVAKNAEITALVDNRNVFDYTLDLGSKYVEGETMITVNFYETSDDAKGLTKYAQSVRTDLAKDPDNDQYRSAGLRFRSNLTFDQKANAVEIGFVVVPDDFIEGDNDWYKVTDGVKDNVTSALVESSLNDKAIVTQCYRVENKTTGKIGDNPVRIEYHYRTGEDYEGTVYYDSKDYQVIITGLTREERQDSLKDIKFSAVMYVVKSDGSVTYYHVADSISYNMVDAVQNPAN